MSSTVQELYQALIVERSKAPRFAGRPEVFDAQGRGENAMCGDRVQVFWQRGGVVHHEAHGCAILTASADLMAQAVAGKSPAEVAAMRGAFEEVVTSGREDLALGDLNALAGVAQYRARRRCATLPWAALEEALREVQVHG
ncbi:Fe-S cluster assembly sulfur transfer protein SufU [Acidocella sp.]|uniref:Fe-S cluster assembly sulfur transfer protein SufU n=1 Tax=Acidocella sp. TaxID=50710 RepID=UPI00262CEEBD|nr:SUF system NifU family Fe-S cluster assembly protein [Acidocella sp.]MDD2795521.1 SUF system NifU family Fe-S cluster assembly protein [Acidocella sp.]